MQQDLDGLNNKGSKITTLDTNLPSEDNRQQGAGDK
jgi:hypothetical protein